MMRWAGARERYVADMLTTASSRIGKVDADEELCCGEEILVGNGRRFRVLAVVPIEEEDSPLVGLLQVEAA
jgi:hypothetical protein